MGCPAHFSRKEIQADDAREGSAEEDDPSQRTIGIDKTGTADDRPRADEGGQQGSGENGCWQAPTSEDEVVAGAHSFGAGEPGPDQNH